MPDDAPNGVAALGWCCATTKVSAEELAAAAIGRAGYRVYLPKYRKILKGVRITADGRRVRSRGYSLALRPLFPNYLFCEIWPEQDLHRLIVCPGVVNLLRRRSGSPQILRAEVIEEIRAAEARGIFDQARPDTDSARPMKRFDLHAGDRVRTAQGDVAELLHLDERNRARLLMKWLGADRLTTIDADELEAAPL